MLNHLYALSIKVSGGPGVPQPPDWKGRSPACSSVVTCLLRLLKLQLATDGQMIEKLSFSYLAGCLILNASLWSGPG